MSKCSESDCSSLALISVLPRIVIYFTTKGETHDGLLPACSS